MLSGKARLLIEAGADAPAVGDWVVGSKEPNGPFVIEVSCPRKTAFLRKAARRHGRIRQGSRPRCSPRTSTWPSWWPPRARTSTRAGWSATQTLAWESGASPVIVITKADLAGDGILELVARASEACPGVPTFAICAPDGKGLSAFGEYLKPRQTGRAARLVGRRQVHPAQRARRASAWRHEEVREFDQHGRHTTTARTLYRLRRGAMVIDTPGLREVQLWVSGDSIDAVFSEIEEAALAAASRIAPMAKSLAARYARLSRTGTIARERYESWLKLRKELAFLETRINPLARQVEKAMLKRRKIHPLAKEVPRPARRSPREPPRYSSMKFLGRQFLVQNPVYPIADRHRQLLGPGRLRTKMLAGAPSGR